jgi:flagellar hook assembly protein FlgD
MFEHNHPDEALDAEINIYNPSGMLVRTLKQEFEPTGSHSREITWDATDNNGAKLPSGVYLYRMKIATAKGIETLAYQKLVIVR